MKILKIIKVIFFLIIYFSLFNCGYQPLLNKENQNFSIVKFNFEGNKRLGGLLKNNFISVKKEENLLVLNVKSLKKTTIADKSQTGKIITYTLTVEFDVSAINISEDIIFSKVYTKTRNYPASDVHIDTLNNEKKLVEELIESIANELQIELNSIYQK